MSCNRQLGRSVGRHVELNAKRGSAGSAVGQSERQKPGLRIRSLSLINSEKTHVRDKENDDCTPTLKKKVSAVCEAGAEMDQVKDVTLATGSQKDPLMQSNATAEQLDHYKRLAEERKQALAETLRQNEELVQAVELGKEEVMLLEADMEQLKTENDQLTQQKNELQETNEILAAENEQLMRLLESAAERGFTLI